MAKHQHYDYDMAVIGGGSAGLTAAYIAQSLGANVLLIDKERLGGDCLWHGCVPSKSLIHVANTVYEARNAARLGLSAASLDVDMAQVGRSIQGIIGHIGEAEEAYTRGVTVQFGHVSFTDPHTLSLNNQRITCRTILIATGSRPTIPDVAGLQEIGYLTNETIFDLQHLPASVAVIGGGPVGVELAQALARLGSQVTLLQGVERLLPREDKEISATLASVFQSEGITLHMGTRLLSVRSENEKKCVRAQSHERTLEIEVDEILLAAGRQPNVQELDLEVAGVRYSAKGIEVNALLQSSAPHIYALGDVVGGYLFTHMASYQAGIAVRNALIPLAKKKVDYASVPWCIFTSPEVAHIGLTEDEARRQHRQVRVVTFPWSEIDRAQTEKVTEGFIKLVLTGKKDRIVGAHLLGNGAGELLGELSLAMSQKLIVSDIVNAIHTYPTKHSGLQQVAAKAYFSSTEMRTNRKLVRTFLKLQR